WWPAAGALPGRGRWLGHRLVLLLDSVDSRTAVRAGQLLGAAGADPAMAVDAFTVAFADIVGGAVIATVDVRDLRRLAGHAAGVTVASIQP
ncbi:MAG: hypothetical protein ACLFXM_15715, partial [Acidimicrobiia bacterium]